MYIKSLYKYLYKNLKCPINLPGCSGHIQENLKCPINLPGCPGHIQDDPEDVLCCLGYNIKSNRLEMKYYSYLQLMCNKYMNKIFKLTLMHLRI